MTKLTEAHRSILLYMGKTVAGVILVMTAAHIFAINDVSWVIISMLLVLSPDSKEVMPLTIIRIKANLVASVWSVVFLVLAPTMTSAICLAIIATIICCHLLSLMSGSRPALAAVVIILLHNHGEHLWSTPLERVAAVVAGCALGLLLTYIFHREMPIKVSAVKLNKGLDASE